MNHSPIWSNRAPAGEYATDAPRGIRDVSRIPRNQVNVHMHARLASGATNVYSDVVTIRRILRLNELTSRDEQLHYRHLLELGHFKIVGNVPPRHDDDMAWTQAVFLRLYVGQLIFDQSGIGHTKLTFFAICHRRVFREAGHASNHASP